MAEWGEAARYATNFPLIPDHPERIKKVITRVLEELKRLGCLLECTPIRTVLQTIRMKTYVSDAKSSPVA